MYNLKLFIVFASILVLNRKKNYEVFLNLVSDNIKLIKCDNCIQKTIISLFKIRNSF